MPLDALFDGLSDPVQITRFDPTDPRNRSEQFQFELNAITTFKKDRVSSIKNQRQEEINTMKVRGVYSSVKLITTFLC